jgi:hypothetical protein
MRDEEESKAMPRGFHRVAAVPVPSLAVPLHPEPAKEALRPVVATVRMRQLLVSAMSAIDAGAGAQASA